MLELLTPRLRLIALSLEHLQLFLEEPSRLGDRLGIPLSGSLANPVVNRAIGMKISKMSQVEPDLHPWYTYWLICRQEPLLGMGMAGFKGAPNAKGEAEIGYGIDPAYQNQGYMTEAARRLVVWAFSHPECQVVTALGVLNDNLASIRVLQKLGMDHYLEGVNQSDWRLTRQAAQERLLLEGEKWG